MAQVRETDAMTMALRKRATTPHDAAGAEAAADPVLDHLRRAARNSRCKGHVDLFGACAALSGNRRTAAQAASEVLMQCLSQALGRRPVLYREGERERSFDETWLLALVRSLRTDDVASATFLLHSRVQPHARRNLVFLLRQVVEGTDRV